MIKTVIFDIGNVLLLFSHEKMLLQFSELLDVPFAALKQKIVIEKLLYEYELGNITTEEWIQAITSLSKRPPSKELFLNAMGAIFHENFPLTSLIPLLKKQGIRLILLSNISEAHFDYIRRAFEFPHAFDDAVLSYKVRSSKPQKEIYHAALKAADAEAYECFYVDDIPEHVRAAKELGLDAVIYESVEQFKKALEDRMVFV
jgi:glucose-1-phosphatase